MEGPSAITLKRKNRNAIIIFNRNLTQEEIAEIESRVNKIIQFDLKVTEEFFSKEDAEEKFNLSKLPDNAGEKIRIIKIGDYDACPCSGLHVSTTKEIGGFRIISTDFKDSVLRIRFKLQKENA
ncbi:MAG: hypothetical protein AMXMBFR51_16080 [Ignavibacteriota bacterium]